MKNLCVVLCLVFIHFFASAQEEESKNGWILPARGQIRVLVVFLEVDYDENPEMQTYEAWPKGEIPKEADLMFDHQITENPQGKITSFFHESSFGSYQVLGDYFPQIITIKQSEAKGRLSSTGLRVLAAEYLSGLDSIKSKNGYTLKDFDAWTNNDKQGRPKVNQPDSSLDHVMLIFRNFHGLMLSRGFASQGSFGNIKNYKSDTYSVFAGPDFQIMRHEYAHLIFGGNNFHCGGGQHNGGGENYFIPLQGGWSTMGNYNSMFLTCNAWDRDRLDWKMPGKSHTISALNAFTKTEVPTYFEPNDSMPPQRVILRDFITSGDAIKIKLPFLHPKEYQQWIWLENHQTQSFNQSSFDQFQYAELDCKPQAKPGIYMYLQVDKNTKSGRGTFGGYGDYLRFIPANGFYDAFWEETEQKTYCANGFMTKPFFKLPQYSNPLTGTADTEYSVSDKNKDGLIKANETDIKWMENRNGEYIGDLQHMGLPAHAFTPTENNRINIGTNPSTASMLTMISLDYDNFKGQKPNNRSVILNGLDIQVLQQFEDGAIEVEINFQHNEINQNLRWCADTIVLNQIVKNGPSLIVKSNKRLQLDRGLTPTRVSNPEDFEDGKLFTSPTRLILKAGAKMVVETKAQLELLHQSTIEIQPGASLVLEKKAALKLAKDCKIIVQPGGMFVPHRKAKLKLQPQQLIGFNL